MTFAFCAEWKSHVDMTFCSGGERRAPLMKGARTPAPLTCSAHRLPGAVTGWAIKSGPASGPARRRSSQGGGEMYEAAPKSSEQIGAASGIGCRGMKERRRDVREAAGVRPKGAG